ncbi:MAG TPA: DUF2442 domain-containing protein, partial [Rhodothermales bacterium]|nr:DUF2442 domain-containing protein [Rhodothermales bacterium]
MGRDFDRDYEQAVFRGKGDVPRATTVRYNVRTRRIDVELTNGMAINVPAKNVEGLQHATVSQLKDGRVRGHGMALRWDSVDADVSVPELFRGVLGSSQWMSELGRAGGRATSAQKTKA